MKKKDLNDIEKQLKSLVKNCKKSEIPKSKTRSKRNGIGLPLTSWMEGARNGEESRIFAVTSGKAKFAYSQYWMGASAIADRVSKKKQITDVQYMLLMNHILERYRGRAPNDLLLPEWILNTETRARSRIFYHINSLCGNSVPLNLILSQELTDLILLKTLIDSALGVKK